MDMREFRDWVRRRAPKLRLDPAHLRSFSWFRQPHDQWPVVLTSSIAYSAFTHICPSKCLVGQDLLHNPLWNSVFFYQPFSSACQVQGRGKLLSYLLLPSPCGQGSSKVSGLRDGHRAAECSNPPANPAIL